MFAVLAILALSLATPVASALEMFRPSRPNLQDVAIWPHSIIQQAPHSRRNFTQGLVLDGASLIESSGLYGQSFVERYRLDDGAVEASYRLADDYFAEGITRLGRKLYLLTWRSQAGLILDADSLQPLGKFHYQGEGWGLTRVGQRLLMSNGSAQLSWRNPEDFKELGTLNVQAGHQAIKHLNALTYGGGLIWANVWLKAEVLAIDPRTGEVVGRVYLKRLARKHALGEKENVLNGLAWDAEQQALWITGKRWSQRYLLKIQPPARIDLPPVN